MRRGFMTEVAIRLGCDRVNLGVVTQGRIDVKALSRSATFSVKTNLVRAVGAAIEERRWNITRRGRAMMTQFC